MQQEGPNPKEGLGAVGEPPPFPFLGGRLSGAFPTRAEAALTRWSKIVLPFKGLGLRGVSVLQRAARRQQPTVEPWAHLVA